MKGAGSRPRDGLPDLPTWHPADMPRRTQAAGYRHVVRRSAAGSRWPSTARAAAAGTTPPSTWLS